MARIVGKIAPQATRTQVSSLSQEFRLLSKLRMRLIWRSSKRTQWSLVAFYITCILGGLFAILGSAQLPSARVTSLTPSLLRELCAGLLVTLGGLAILDATLLGIGVYPRFLDVQLRRYPLSRATRFIARHILSISDPLWVALGMASLAGSLWLGASPAPALPASLAFVIICYSGATLLSVVSEVYSRSPKGIALIAFGLFVALLGAATVAGQLDRQDTAGRAIAMHVAEWTPIGPISALIASVPEPSVATCWARLSAWILVGALVLWGAERLPALQSCRSPVASGPIFRPLDRFAAVLGLPLPLALKVFRYHFRSSRFWVGYVTSLPALILPVYAQRSGQDTQQITLLSMGLISVVGFASTAYLSMNMFGFDGPGFRRYFLLPVSGQEVLLVSSIIPILLGIPPVLIATLSYAALLERLNDVWFLLLLLGMGLGALCLLMAVGLVTSVLWPESSPLHSPFRSRARLPSILSITGTSALLLFAILNSGPLHALAPQSAMFAFCVAGVGMAVYWLMIPPAAAALSKRRADILSILESDGRRQR